MLDVKEVDKLINYMLRNVSPHIRDDCYQAAYVGVLEASKKYDSSKSKFSTYLRAHKGYIQHHILKEVAKLTFPFTISKTTFLSLDRYKRGDFSGMSEGKIRAMKKLASIKKYSYDKDTEA